MMGIPQYSHGVCVTSPGVLNCEEISVSQPDSGKLLVKNEYTGVNYIDLYHCDGTYKVKMPHVIGREGSGTVVAVGDKVSDFQIGDRVAYIANGSYAKYTIIDAKHTVQLPSEISFEMGAAMLLQGMTATYLVEDSYRVQPNDFVLVTGAAGGTGGLICQLARRMGATVIGMCSSEEKDVIALNNGAHYTIRPPSNDQNKALIKEKINEITGGVGCNVLYDGVGADMWPFGLDLLAKRGKYINFGNASGVIKDINPFLLTPKCRSFMRTGLMEYIETRDEFLALANSVINHVIDGSLRIPLFKVYNGLNLCSVKEAHRDLQGRKTSGKLLIRIDDSLVLDERVGAWAGSVMWPFPVKAWYLIPKNAVNEDSSAVEQRKNACKFISQVSSRLRFPLRTCLTAQLYFHIFFTKHSFVEYPPMDIALTCILVACKAEETYKRIKQIIAAAILTLHPEHSTDNEDGIRVDEEHRLRVTQYEHLVLAAIDYNFVIRHVFEVMGEMLVDLRVAAKYLGMSAWSVVEKVYYSPIILVYPPEYLAVYVIKVTADATLVGKVEKYFKQLGMDPKIFEDIKTALLPYLD